MDNKLFEKLHRDGILVITSSINSKYASEIILSLLNWSNEDSSRELQLYISSYSNDFTNIMAIYDVLQTMKNPISGFCIGMVGGCSTLLLAGCNKGKRYALKNSEIIMGEISGIISSGSNQQTEIEIAAKEATEQKEIFENLLAKHTGQTKEAIHKYCLEERVLSSKEAIEFGLFDEILE